jgi:hypothetical protein
VSVIAPPEVERPYDLAYERSSLRVAEYRTWTRSVQASLLSFTLALVTLTTAIGLAGGRPPWEPSLGALAAQSLLFTVVFMVFEAIWEGRGLRRRLAAAEPLPEGADEIGVSLLGLPLAALRGAALAVLFGAASLILDEDASATVVAVAVGLGVGRMLGLELLLRRVVERADPLRTFFVSLDADALDSPLLWRSAL